VAWLNNYTKIINMSNRDQNSQNCPKCSNRDKKNMAIESAPMYIAVAQAKKRAKNPPAAAKDISSDMTMAFMVAVRKKSINTSSPVRDTKETVPTCSKKEKQTSAMINLIVKIETNL
jgi:hypothetical protein